MSELLKWERATESLLLPLVVSIRNTGMISAGKKKKNTKSTWAAAATPEEKEREKGACRAQAGHQASGLVLPGSLSQPRGDGSQSYSKGGQDPNNPNLHCAG